MKIGDMRGETRIRDIPTFAEGYLYVPGNDDIKIGRHDVCGTPVNLQHSAALIQEKKKWLM